MKPLAIPGAWVIRPVIHEDSRGSFREWFRRDEFTEVTGRSFPLAQANCSLSRRGVIRGIHFADTPPGQAKYVTCMNGAVLDVIVDVRTGSPTFGEWDSVRLAQADHAVFISEGLGHAFMALSAVATVSYLCTEPYAPAGERAVSPFDPQIGITWPAGAAILSDKDLAAPTLAEALAEGWLPRWEDA